MRGRGSRMRSTSRHSHPKTETWPLYRPLVRWLVNRLPEGGEHRSPAGSRSRTRSSATRSSLPAPQRRSPNPAIGSCCCDSSSLVRVTRCAGAQPASNGQSATRPTSTESIPLDVVLDAPDLLRAFIPFVHAQSGIREELTSRTLAAIDELRSSFRREVLREADYWWLDDAV